MSVKIKRFQSLEAGPFDPNGGRTEANIKVPASVGMTDPENSYVVFRMSAECTSNGAAGSTLLPAFLGQPTNEGTIWAGGAQALIRNAKVTSESNGFMNEQRDQNVVNANLDYYTITTDQQAAQKLYNGAGDFNTGLSDTADMNMSPFMVYQRPSALDTTVNTPSTVQTTEVRVPMKHIDRFADGIRQFPNMAVGDLNFFIELETVRNVVGSGNRNLEALELLDMNASGSEFGSSAAPLIQVPDNGSDSYDDGNLDLIPFYVGEPVTLQYDDAGAKTHDAVVESLKVNGTTGELEIVINPPAPATGAAVPATDLTLAPNYDNPTFTWTIADIFLELHLINLTPKQMEQAEKALNNLEIPWMEYRLVKKVLNQTGDYSETIDVPPMCAAVALMTPQNNELVSGKGQKTIDYRWALDGKNVITRDIRVGPLTNNSGVGVARQLHNYMLQKWFGNVGKRLMRFDRPSEDYTAGDNERSHVFYPLVTPVMNRSAIANINLRTETGNISTRETFFLTVHPRMLTLKNGRLQS